MCDARRFHNSYPRSHWHSVNPGYSCKHIHGCTVPRGTPQKHNLTQLAVASSLRPADVTSTAAGACCPASPAPSPGRTPLDPAAREFHQLDSFTQQSRTSYGPRNVQRGQELGKIPIHSAVQRPPWGKGRLSAGLCKLLTGAGCLKGAKLGERPHLQTVLDGELPVATRLDVDQLHSLQVHRLLGFRQVVLDSSVGEVCETLQSMSTQLMSK